jgi:hypothetical protein
MGSEQALVETGESVQLVKRSLHRLGCERPGLRNRSDGRFEPEAGSGLGCARDALPGESAGEALQVYEVTGEDVLASLLTLALALRYEILLIGSASTVEAN